MSPTLSLEALLITSTIDDFEGRDVSMVYVPGAFLTADMDEEVYMCIRGCLAELMVQTAHAIYWKCTTVGNNNTPILYVKLQKALYGCLRSALLFYLKLVEDLESDGFKINPYDPCVAHKGVNNKKITITWHVDGLKLSHMEKNEVTQTIERLKSIYGQDMRVSRGKKHDNLGIDLDFTNPGEVKITMIDYLKGVLEEFPEVITRNATSPGADHLFIVRPYDERKLPGESRALAFHHSLAQLLFSSTRARKDIQTTVTFLTTRVREPDKDDWEKLRIFLMYVNSTINMPLLLRADNLKIIKWWVGASFTTHDDCRGHTGATMSLGNVSIIGMSKKQKNNTRSST
jgi:hypothetical protein